MHSSTGIWKTEGIEDVIIGFIGFCQSLLAEIEGDFGNRSSSSWDFFVGSWTTASDVDGSKVITSWEEEATVLVVNGPTKTWLCNPETAYTPKLGTSPVVAIGIRTVVFSELAIPAACFKTSTLRDKPVPGHWTDCSMPSTLMIHQYWFFSVKGSSTWIVDSPGLVTDARFWPRGNLWTLISCLTSFAEKYLEIFD